MEENTEAKEGLELSDVAISEGICALLDVPKAVDFNIALVDRCVVAGLVVLANRPSSIWAAAAFCATRIVA